MLVKRLTKELKRIENKLNKVRHKYLVLRNKEIDLVEERHELKSLINIEEMKERNKHEIHNK